VTAPFPARAGNGAGASAPGPLGAEAAPALSFAIENGGVLDHAAVPTLSFALRVETDAGQPVRSVALNVQIRIAATRRSYDERAQERLVELFGKPDQWGRNLHAMHWMNLTLQVPPFTGSTVVELPVTCTYDFEVSAAKYFHALEEGEVPLEFLFSGTVFYADSEGRLQVGRITWEQTAEFRLPVAVWRDMMDRHFPDSAWLRLRRESFDRLHAFKAAGIFLTWDDAVDALLRAAGESGR
jgi:Family of unknown function (DUF6084)